MDPVPTEAYFEMYKEMDKGSHLGLQFYTSNGSTHNRTHTTQSEDHCWGLGKRVCWMLVPWRRSLRLECLLSSAQASGPASVPEAPPPSP